MYESGYYPLGAEYDPRAPWNEKEPNMVKCEACDGKGSHWYAYNIETNEETECTEEAWLCLPETEDATEANGQHYCRGEKEICEVCGGIGEIEYEEDYEPDYDDYYE